MAKLSCVLKYKDDKEKDLLSLSRKMGLDLPDSCGGKGKCGKCTVIILSGDVNKPTKDEEKKLKKKELEDGVRLACQVIPKGDVSFKVE
ncbi:2Fe-2S iron-sulfur cluster-binding protein [Acidaminobacter hydrogenoformans]|uniref:2Fe-2S iron-sulfur cluster binding domain-containing protein n=1 Tax=Acidaminobacter hydrogenoformans DSM 2784 TaxID=1120920 RepID=A0A1G5RXB9_9FIRM|nr:2Fe-2S iron-sulfur cluster-binding protein [Acidaminobacter hydrogenoformans]SCZ78764.1 2Fe-2S iron-sulfur cluster binding domain-containing protein [Acidaminobacter hydrogenoformans DSM 2784]